MQVHVHVPLHLRQVNGRRLDFFLDKIRNLRLHAKVSPHRPHSNCDLSDFPKSLINFIDLRDIGLGAKYI